MEACPVATHHFGAHRLDVKHGEIVIKQAEAQIEGLARRVPIQSLILVGAAHLACDGSHDADPVSALGIKKELHRRIGLDRPPGIL